MAKGKEKRIVKKATVILTALIMALTVMFIPQTVCAKSKIPTTTPKFTSWKANTKTKVPQIDYTASWKKVKAHEYRYSFIEKEKGFATRINSHGYTCKTRVSGNYKASTSILKKAKKKGELKVTIEVNARACDEKGHQGSGKTASKTVKWKYNRKNGLWYKK